MVSALSREVAPPPETQLATISGLAAFVSLFTTVYVSGTVLAQLPEMILPLGVSAGLGLFTIRVVHREYESACTAKMARYGWVGGLIAVAVGGWWLVLHLHYEMPVVGLPEQIATLVTGGIATGLVIGRVKDDEGHAKSDESARPAVTLKQDHLVGEIGWTSYSGPNPISSAIVDLFAELEGESAPQRMRLYEHVDPDIFADLRYHDGEPWQVWFRIEQYVLCVSSLGTVTAYSRSDEETSATISSGSDTDRDPTFRL